MYKNRIEHIKPMLLGMASCYADDMPKLLELTEDMVKNDNYAGIALATTLIVNFLQLLPDGIHTHYAIIPQISQNLREIIAYIEAVCASEESKSNNFAFTSGSNRELWKLAQNADEIMQNIKDCTTKGGLDEVVCNEAQPFKEHLEFTKTFFGPDTRPKGMDERVYKQQDGQLANMISRIEQSIESKAKEVDNQKKDNHSFSSISF